MRIACRIRSLFLHRELLLIAGVYLAAVVFVVPPVDPYPTGDDWNYAVTAREFVETGHIRLGAWPAMTLVTHAVWGSGFLYLFGESWVVLRASMMVMAWLGGVAIYRLALDFTRPRIEAAMLCGCYVVAPVVLAFSYTFYTDITGTSLMLVTVAAFSQTLRRGSWKAFAGAGLLAGIAFLARQTAAIPAVVFVLLLFWWRRSSSAVVTIVGGIIPLLSCYVWLYSTDGLPTGFGRLEYDFPLLLQIKPLVGKLAAILLEAALFVTPLAAMRGACGVRSMTLDHRRILLLGGLWIGFVIFFAEELRPYRGWAFYDWGLGLLPTYLGAQELKSPTIGGTISVFHFFVLVVAAAALPLLAVVFWKPQSAESDSPESVKEIRAVIFLSTVLYLFVLLISKWVYDRYLIPFVGLIIAFDAASHHRPNPRGSYMAAAVCLFLGLACSLIGIQDSIAAKDAYWMAVMEIQDEGTPLEEVEFALVDPRELPAGLFGTGEDHLKIGENTLRVDAANSAVDSPSWRIAYRAEPGWTTVKKIPYSSWVRSSRFLILKRDDSVSQKQANSASGRPKKID